MRFCRPISLLSAALFSGPTIDILNNEKHANLDPSINSHFTAVYDDVIIAKADALARIFKEERGVPGLAVAVAVNGRIVWHQGYGYSDLENLVPCTPKSLFRIGSISKSITSVIIGKLFERNFLDLDAPVQKYVPDFPEKEIDQRKVVITTRHLLSHLSGVRHYQLKNEALKPIETCKCGKKLSKNEFDHDEYYIRDEFKTIADALKLFQNDELLHRPGSKFLYTTHGWTLISAVAEGAYNNNLAYRAYAGNKLATFEHLVLDMCQKIGMQNTIFDRNQPLIAYRSKFYKRDHRLKLINTPEVNNSYKWAGGGILSTVDDLALFAIELINSYVGHSESLLKQKTVKLLWTPVQGTNRPNVKSCPNYGMGWCIKSSGDLEKSIINNAALFPSDQLDLIVGHMGGSVGASSALYIKISGSDQSNIAVIVLTNLQQCGGLHDFAEKLCGIFDCDFDQ